MLDFQLFRMKVTRIPGSLFSTDEKPPALIREAINSQPERMARRGVVWHIGNVEPIDERALYFAFGRTTRASLPLFDATRRNFLEQEFESAPFTHVIVDADLGLCAIARKSQLASHTVVLARQLAAVLNSSATAYNKFVRFAVEELKDPEQFIEQLRSAFAVLRFSITFSQPNPWDVNADFQLPMERLLDEADGTSGRTTIKGADLDREVLEELSRSAAATGNDASARIYRAGDAQPVNKHLHENVVSVSVAEVTMLENRQGLVQTLRELYLRIRGRTDG